MANDCWSHNLWRFSVRSTHGRGTAQERGRHGARGVCPFLLFTFVLRDAAGNGLNLEPLAGIEIETCETSNGSPIGLDDLNRKPCFPSETGVSEYGVSGKKEQMHFPDGFTVTPRLGFWQGPSLSTGRTNGPAFPPEERSDAWSSPGSWTRRLPPLPPPRAPSRGLRERRRQVRGGLGSNHHPLRNMELPSNCGLLNINKYTRNKNSHIFGLYNIFMYGG